MPRCDGRCIPHDWVSDGWPDCMDGADEATLAVDGKVENTDNDTTSTTAGAIIFETLVFVNFSSQDASILKNLCAR